MRKGNNRCQSSEVGVGLAHSEASEVTECAACGGGANAIKPGNFRDPIV